MRVKLGLSVFGTTFAMGLHPDSERPMISPCELIDQAVAAGLNGVEFPLRIMQGQSPQEIAAYAKQKDVFITVAGIGYDCKKLTHMIQTADLLGGSRTVRTVVGGADFGGDRRRMKGKWQPFLQEVLTQIGQAVQVAEKEGITLAIENHQDLTSEELIWLCEQIGSRHIGITFDTGNPLGTAEEPMSYVQTIAPYIKNVHIKDYWIYLDREGYRLVRCPVGQGVLDLPGLITVINKHSPGIPMVLELAALEARYVRVLADDFWPEYPKRSARSMATLMSFVLSHAKPAGDWRTPFERGANAETITAYEEHQLRASLAYLTPFMQSLG